MLFIIVYSETFTHLIKQRKICLISFVLSVASSSGEFAKGYPNGLNLITQLYQMYFLVEPQEDERVYVNSLVESKKKGIQDQPSIGGIQLIINNNCNLGCKYCFAGTADDRRYAIETQTLPIKMEESKAMSFETAILVISEFKELREKQGHNTLVVKFFGGEPLLSSHEMKRVVSHFTSIQAEDNFRIHWVITTNGSAITDSMAKFFRTHNFTVTISIDGTEKYQNLLLFVHLILQQKLLLIWFIKASLY